MDRAKTKNVFLLFAFIFACVLAFFGPLLSLPYYYDDRSVIQDNALIRSFSGLAEVFGGQVDSQNEMNGAYRPLLLSWVSLVGAAFNHAPWGHRLMSFLLHALNTCLLFWVLTGFLALPRLPSLLGCLGFALHPVHVTSLSLVWKQSDLWIAFFTLFTVYLSQRSTSAWPMMGLLILALGFKESGVLVALVGFLAVGADPKLRAGRTTSHILRGFAALGVILCFFWFRARILQPARISTDGNPFSGVTYFLTQWHVIPKYLAALIGPSRLSIDRDIPVVSSAGGYEILGMLGLAAFVGFCLRRLWRGNRLYFLPMLGLLWLVPTSSFQPLSLLYDETRMYLAIPALLLPFILLARALLDRAKDPKFGYGAVLGTLLMLGAVHALHRGQWSSEEAIWKQPTRLDACAARAHYELGRIYEAEKALDDAELEFKKAASCTGDLPQAWLRLGIVLGKKGELQKAEDYFWIATRAPEFWSAQAYYHLGLSRYYQKRFKEAASFFSKAHALSPQQGLCEKGSALLSANSPGSASTRCSQE